MNILMMVIIGAGIYSAATLRRESFPNFDLDMIMVSVPYPVPKTISPNPFIRIFHVLVFWLILVTICECVV